MSTYPGSISKTVLAISDTLELDRAAPHWLMNPRREYEEAIWTVISAQPRQAASGQRGDAPCCATCGGRLTHYESPMYTPFHAGTYCPTCKPSISVIVAQLPELWKAAEAYREQQARLQEHQSRVAAMRQGIGVVFTGLTFDSYAAVPGLAATQLDALEQLRQWSLPAGSGRHSLCCTALPEREKPDWPPLLSVPSPMRK